MEYEIGDISRRLKSTREYLDITAEQMAEQTCMTAEAY
jgi:cytoskeletal protein RodZ